MSDPLSQYYRLPEHWLQLEMSEAGWSGPPGYFRFGPDVICYGTWPRRRLAGAPSGALPDALVETRVEAGETYLPFDWIQVADNLRFEVYAQKSWHENSPLRSAVNAAYYFFRPLMPVALRKHLQRIRLNGWRHATFPRWPVDTSVDSFFAQLLLLSLRSQGWKSVPFIWFWPEGASSCAMMTHDVETVSGRDLCPSLMDLDESFGIRSSFQTIPEGRYQVSAELLDSIRSRGNEVNIQDLSHDGHLFRSREEFMVRAGKINAYARQYGARGFRSAVLYRRQDWLHALQFAYDMSVPNVAHLDPQPGGCCTVMPYFNGDLLELPVTTTQDYSLFHILNDYSLDLWKRQIELIMEKHGLISFIIHPDYIGGAGERQVYESLLTLLAELRAQRGVWITTPGEVNDWWRQRAKMELIKDGMQWKIEGKGKERAVLAYAREENGRLAVSFSDQPRAVGV